ncbi:MAG TPA: exonuclease SbcCD subunit D [Holophagaceae bacterium]
MRFLHTSDWHLGKTLCHADLLDDQAHALDELAAMLQDTRAEALVVAGDIYDRAVPPREAVALLDQFLHRMARDLAVPVLMIAGNHDSPERLGFASAFLASHGLHVAGPLVPEPGPVVIGGAAFHLLPYGDPAVGRQALGDPTIRTHQELLATQLIRAQERHPEGCRFVAVAHAFVTGGLVSDSELGLGVGGAGQVDAAVFGGCDYTALGHLHRPQDVGGSSIRYAGSLLKYSASEAAHVKAATLVELPDRGPVRTEPLPFSPRRDLRRLRGTFAELLSGIPGNREDYLFIDLVEEGPVLDAMARLRQVYPNLLGLQPATLSAAPEEPVEILGSDPRDLDPERLFEAFYRQSTGRDLGREEWALFREALARAEAEASA